MNHEPGTADESLPGRRERMAWIAVPQSHAVGGAITLPTPIIVFCDSMLSTPLHARNLAHRETATARMPSWLTVTGSDDCAGWVAGAGILANATVTGYFSGFGVLTNPEPGKVNW